MMLPFFSGSKASAPPKIVDKSALDKLSGYHELARDAVHRAVTKDEEGNTTAALKIYQVALDACAEGLQLQAPAGVDPANSNVMKWRREMQGWADSIRNRMRVLQSQGASSSVPPELAQAGRSPRLPVNRATSGDTATFLGAAADTVTATTGTTTQPRATWSKEEQRLRDVILLEVLDKTPSVTWSDVAGLPLAKQALHEMVVLPTLRADLFQGLRAPARGLLLYGPPGNGKTMLAKALAREAKATFFAISASSLTSKWHGEAEKLVRMLFRIAEQMQPSIIFIDEIDSILSERSQTEHDAARRLKTEFLVQFDGVTGGSDRVMVIGATNRPWDLDEAVRRRLVKRVYIPLPDTAARLAIVQHLLDGQRHSLTRSELGYVVNATAGYSGSDLAALCREAAMVPIRELGPRIKNVAANAVRAVRLDDFSSAIRAIRPSVSAELLTKFEAWTNAYGTAAG